MLRSDTETFGIGWVRICSMERISYYFLQIFTIFSTLPIDDSILESLALPKWRYSPSKLKVSTRNPYNKPL